MNADHFLLMNLLYLNNCRTLVPIISTLSYTLMILNEIYANKLLLNETVQWCFAVLVFRMITLILFSRIGKKGKIGFRDREFNYYVEHMLLQRNNVFQNIYRKILDLVEW